MARTAAEKPVALAGVTLTHAGRVLYPEQGITKRALALYYQAVAPWMLPQVVDRPLSLVRCPAGEGGACFYQKHFDKGLPEGLHGVAIREKAGEVTYAVIEDLAGLVGLVQIGVLEIHPWGATAARLETPDRLIFDMDPDPSLPWRLVAEAALAMRALLADLGLKSFAKSTGGKGLHVVAPLQPRHDWATLAAAARALAERLAATAPDLYTVDLAKSARPGRIFIDYLRNNRGQTAVAPYSPRARAGAPVATPLSWAEVESAKRPDRHTVITVPRRLKRLTQDPWADMLSCRQTLGAKLLRDLGV